MAQTAMERFVEKVVVDDTKCWVWTAHKDDDGYGQFCGDDGRTRQAHVWIWEQTLGFSIGGQLPEGMELDHLCVNPMCVNPEHLELVTAEENKRRMRAHQSRLKSMQRGLDWVDTEVIAPVDAAFARLELRAQVTALRREGASTTEVSAALNVSERLVLRELAASGDPEALKQVTHERLEELIAGAFHHLDAGDSKTHRRAAQTILNSIRQQSRLLGLDAPKKIDHNHTGNVEIDLRVLTGEDLAELKADLRARIETIDAEEKAQGGELIEVAAWSEAD